VAIITAVRHWLSSFFFLVCSFSFWGWRFFLLSVWSSLFQHQLPSSLSSSSLV
jgi:hypothetical protein